MGFQMLPYDFPGFDSLEVYGISDMHVGSAGFSETEFKKLTDHVLAAENRYLVFSGDLVDNGLRNSKTSPYGATMQPAAQRNYAVELLTPLKDRILIMIDGNHEARSLNESDQSPTETIALRMGIGGKYTGDIGFVKIDLYSGKHNSKVRRPKYSIGVHHGLGGMTPGASLNKMVPLAMYWGVDLLISGHTHQPVTAPYLMYEPDLSHNLMIPREGRVIINTGWLEYCGYAVTKGYRGAPIRSSYAILDGNKYDIAVMT